MGRVSNYSNGLKKDYDNEVIKNEKLENEINITDISIEEMNS